MSEGAPGSVCIVGGGISGLALAFFLHRRGIAVTVLEAKARPGGTVASERADGWIVEGGPNSTLRRSGIEDALGRLVQDVGLGDRLRAANPLSARRFVLRGGQLIPLPATPPAFLSTPLFSRATKVRLLAEPLVGRARDDESIASFVRRRLGAEFLDYAVEPFISGVYAGNPETLSVRAATPRIHALEARYGSLILGAIARGRIARQAGSPRGTIVSFAGGMAELTDRIAQVLPQGAVCTGCSVRELKPLEGGGWSVAWNGGEAEFGRVVIATPADEAAALLRPLAPAAAQALEAIPYAPVASVALGYRRGEVAHPLDGFGFLAPRREGLRTLGALFSSSLFAGRAPAGHVLLTAFIGGMTDPAAEALPEDELIAIVTSELGRLLGISGTPVLARVHRWPRAIPQYTLGHLDRIADVDQALAAFPNLSCVANWRGGVALADCVRNAETAAAAARKSR